jgi:hypothetical protein
MGVVIIMDEELEMLLEKDDGALFHQSESGL